MSSCPGTGPLQKAADRQAAITRAAEHRLPYIDEGYGGSSLIRPALERLRDAVAAGGVEQLYGHAPDWLARRYAHQALLIEEFRRAGVEVVVLNRPISGTAEDDLLLQMQGVIAECERANILERIRRGRPPTRPRAWLARSATPRSVTITCQGTRAAEWRASR
jgi:DNA invertase Pin-like site-specific DNA recombinase